MKPHKIKAYLIGFTLGCILVGTLLSLRMINQDKTEKTKFTFKPIPPEKLISSNDPIHPSLALMVNTKNEAERTLILEDILPNQYIRVEESVNADNQLMDRKVLMADRLNLSLKAPYQLQDLEPILADLQAELLDTTQPVENFYPIKLRSHSPHSLEKALNKLSQYSNIILSAEKVEFSREAIFSSP